MRVLTLNTWQEFGPWRERWEVIDKNIREAAPDIIFFQEMFNRKWAQETAARLGYPTCITQEEPSGLVMLSRYTVLEGGLFSYHAFSPTEKKKRYAQHVWFETPDAGDFLAVNTHLSWRPDEQPVRYRQAVELAQAIDAMRDNGPVILGGDLNADVDTSEIDMFRARARFQDAYAKHHPHDYGWTWSRKNPYTQEPVNLVNGKPLPDRRVDYIFYRSAEGFSLECKGSRLVMDQPDSRGIWCSDHFGVLAEF